MSLLQKGLVKRKLPPLGPRSAEHGSGRMGSRQRDYTPVSWDKYFENAKDVSVSDGNVFRVYTSGNSGPLLLLLHGGGYCGLTWALFTTSIMNMVECQVAAIDLRGHGETSTLDNEDLSSDTMSCDVGNVINAMFEDVDAPPIILIGHSMGGAIAVHAAHRNLISSCIGLIVIDVVEGTAMDALQSMQSFLGSRPSSFLSLEKAIEWCVRSGQVRNVESARVSMPGQLKSSSTDKPATGEVSDTSTAKDENNSLAATTIPRRADSILEEEEEEEENADTEINSSIGQRALDDLQWNPREKRVLGRDRSQSLDSGCLTDASSFRAPLQAKSTKYTWRINLGKTETFWAGWFQGLSSLFLSTREPKLLLLAGIDRLDKELTIGQMQGKFQMQVLPQCGHAVHEDVPEKVAEAISSFLVRHKFANPTSDFNRSFPGC